MRPLFHRPSYAAAAGLLALALTAGACSSSSSSTSASGSGTIASELTLGGPAECQTNAFCIPGLQRVYGITFKSFKVLDADGPLTYQALTHGQIDVGEAAA